MNVGNSVRLSIHDWLNEELDSAMLHACNAVDGTAKKARPKSKNKHRFITLLRENYDIIGPMGLPQIDIYKTRFAVKLKKATATGGADIADLIYGIHRCCHAHGDELPDGFQLLPHLKGPVGHTQFIFRRGSVQLSDRIISALLAVAVMSPLNHDQKIACDYYLTYEHTHFPIDDWWGRLTEFRSFLKQQPSLSLNLDFSPWMQKD